MAKKLPHLTFLRYIAAIWVIFFHYFTNKPNLPKTGYYSDKILENGNLGVNFFFILSGFILTHVYLNKKPLNLKEFYLKRIKRIYPLYLLALFISILIFKINPINNLIDVLLNIFGLQYFFESSNIINIPSWSVGYEMFFYLLFPYLLKITPFNSSLGKMFLGFFLTTLFIYTINEDYFNSSLPQWFWLFQTFLFGIYGRLLLINNTIHSILSKNGKTILLISVLTFITLIVYFDFNFFRGNSILNLILTLIILCFATLDGKTLFSKILENEKLIICGEISYSLYILQSPTYMFVKTMNLTHPRLEYLLFLFILHISAYTSYKYIELPIIKK
jgi:peptidoglycan/LPS O-acetylase OafA/YrhL